MKPDVWMPLYISDYLRKTMHLTTVQHGAYMLLLMACWDRGGKLPNDPAQLAGIARCSPADWRKLSPIILPFFDEEDGGLVQGRVVEEHQKASRLSDARRQAGALGGRPPKSQNESNRKPKGFANEKLNETPTRVAPPSPSQGSEEPSSLRSEEPSALPDLNADAWSRAKALLVERGGMKPAQVGGFFGKLLRDNAIEAQDLLTALVTAQKNGTTDPQGYLKGAARRLGGKGGQTEIPDLGWC